MVNEQFFIDVGLQKLNPAYKPAFWAEVKKELERRISNYVLHQLNPDQRELFESLENEELSALQEILERFGDYQRDPVFHHIAQIKRTQLHDDYAERFAVKEYLKAKLLQSFLPNIGTTYNSILQDIKVEIFKQKDKILQHNI